MLHVEDLPLTEQAPAHLMESLERRAEDVLAYLHAVRRQAEASQAYGSRLEQQNQTLNAELASLKASGSELQARLAELEQQLIALETQRLELAEENRELDEQNRELEGHNRHLQERLAQAGAVESSLPRRARQSRGLSALMGHYRDPVQTAPKQAPIDKALTEPAVAPEQPAQPELERSADESAATPAPAPVSTPAQREPAREQAPSPQALLEQWYGRYDSAFFKGHTRPLKVGIHEDLAALEPWPEKLVRRALACYVNLPRYLKAVRDGAERIDLDGQPAGQVDEGAATHARRKLERLQSERAASQAGKRGDRNKERGDRKRRAGSSAAGAADGSDKTRGAQPARRVGQGAAQKSRPERSASKPKPADGGVNDASDAKREDPAERMQRKLDALMARHSGQ
jgi:ProP effector